MRVKNPITGKVHDVTDRAYKLVYKPAGFVPAEGEGEIDQKGKQDTPQGGNDQGAGNDQTGANGSEAGQGGADQRDDQQAGKLTEAEVAAMMEKKQTVMAALKKHGVPFSDRTGVDELREMLKAALAEKGLID